MKCDGCLHLESEWDGAIKNALEADSKVKALELQVEELQNVIWSLDLFVNVYDGTVLDKKRAKDLVARYGKPPKDPLKHLSNLEKRQVLQQNNEGQDGQK